MDNTMTPEIIDKCVARLHWMKLTIGARGFEQGAQFHEAMAATTRVEGVKSNHIFFVALERATAREAHRFDPVLSTAALGHNIKSHQVTSFVAIVRFLHDCFDFARCERCRHEIVFVRQNAPGVVNRFWTGDKIALIVEETVKDAIDDNALTPQSLCIRRADQSLEISRVARATTPVQSFS